ncbi:hypothetical protein M9458_007748, partial [Cirrhinus mrigala]
YGPRTHHSPNLIVSPIVWNQDHDIQHATLQEPTPPECPEGKIYVPHSQRQNLLGTAHQSPGSGLPGSKRTSRFLKLVTGGPVCAVIPS